MIYLQLGSIIGAVVGWIDGRPARGDVRGALAALPIGATLLALGLVDFWHQMVPFTALGSVGLGYGLAFLARRARGEHR